MDDEINNLDNVSELKLLESLDLGHRRVFKEEAKQKDNDEFLENINFLLSKLNERIDTIKNLPKLEIKGFDIESINSNNDNNIININIDSKNNIDNSNNNISKNINPYRQNSSKNQMNNQISNISDTNNLQNNEINTPNPDNNKRVFVIPDSFNEKRNNNLNQLNNIITPEGKYNLEKVSNNEDSKIKEDNNNNSNNNIINDSKDNLKEKNENMNNKSGIENERDNQNNKGENNIDDKSDKNHDADEQEIDMNKNNLDDILSIPELSEKNDNKQKKSLEKNEPIESQNLLNPNIKHEEIEEDNNENDKEINQNKENKKEDNINQDDKNFNLDVEAIEEFEPEKNDNNENNQKNILKNMNNNEKNQLNKSKESEERTEKNESEILKEETENQREEKKDKENLEKESQQNKQDNKIKENNQTEEDQYDKQYKEIEQKFNKIVSVCSGNGQQETNPENKFVQEKAKEKPEENNKNDNDSENRESENRENSEKNKLKEKIVKKDEDEEISNIVEIESMKNVPKEEKKSEEEKKSVPKKENVSDIVEIESMNNNKKEEEKVKEDKKSDFNKENVSDIVEIESMNNTPKKENNKKEEKKNEIKKEKEDKKEEDEIQDDSISEQQQDNNKSNKNSEKEKERIKESKNENTNNKKINNLSNISKNIEEELCPSSSRNKQSVLNKLNTMPQIKTDGNSIKNKIRKSLTQKDDILIQIKYNPTEKDESSPDISNIDEIPVINNINTEEKSLEQIIPDFNENILKNEKDDIDVRKASLIKKKHIPLKISDGQNYSQFFGDIDVPHTELMKNNYNEEQLKSMLKYNSTFKENIFDKLPFDEINSPIGQVESFNSFCQKYCLTKENLKIQDVKNNLSSTFSKWRKILGDGNSFYRIIMFSIIEAYILNKNIDELKYLLFDIISQENIIIYKQKNIDVEICCMIFAEILFLLENDDNVKAYEIFTKAYTIKDGSFDKMLVIYLRHILAIYTENVKELLPQPEKNNVNNTNIFNSYMIESYNLEPSFLNICCIQYLFDIKMNLVYLQGCLNEPEQRSINLVGEEEDCPFINIGFFYNSYHKLYPENFEVTYNYDLPMQVTANKQLTCILKELRPCEECKTNTEHILFIEKKYVICKLCLEDALTKICNFRADAFQKNGFLGVEYYTRPINIGDSYYIDDYEIIELLESNILETLTQKYLGSMCVNCCNREENIIELKCGCGFCKTCLIEKVLNITSGVKVLNELEKKQIKNAKCSCGKPFDIEEGLKYITKNKEDKAEALNRLKKYINILCLICSKELRKEGENDDDYKEIDEKIEYKKIKMKKSNEKNPEGTIYESDHLICENCYKQFLRKKIDLKEESDYEDEDESETKNDFVDFDKGLISCSICCRKHLFRITQNENCCAGDCNIY